jgi:NhaP-type Na+/H+ or K+/H+ antiporter
MEFTFLPSFPPELNPAILFGLMLLAGIAGGELLRRGVGLPRVTGYVLTGLLLGPAALNLISAELMTHARPIVDVAIGLVLYELGHRLDLSWFRHNAWLLVTAIAESALTFCAIFAGLYYFDYSLLVCALAAAMGVATSPAIVLLVSHELRTEGQLTERLMSLTAVNTAVAAVLLIVLLPWLHMQHAASAVSTMLHPIYVLCGSFVLGFIIHRAVVELARWLGKREDRQYILLIGAIVLAVGLARALHLSVVLALLAMGVLARNQDAKRALLAMQFGYGGQLFLVVLFVYAGASLDFSGWREAGAAIVVFLLLRFAAKAVAITAFSAASALRPGSALWLAAALLPMSEIAWLMMHDTVAIYPDFGPELTALLLGALALSELLAPIVTGLALRRADEAHPEGELSRV